MKPPSQELRGSAPQNRKGLQPYLSFHFVIPKAEVLEVGSGVGLHRWELVLEHVNDLRQLRVSPGKLPWLENTFKERC